MKKTPLLVAVALILGACNQNKETTTQTEQEVRQDTVAVEQAAADSLAQLQQQQADSIAKAEALDKQARKMITTIFMAVAFDGNESVDPNAFIEKNCTARLKNKLRKAYEEDYGEADSSDGGYAVWEFRSGMTDVAYEGAKSKIYKIVPLGNNRYRYDYSDGGHKGSHTVQFVEQDGKLLMDDIDLAIQSTY